MRKNIDVNLILDLVRGLGDNFLIDFKTKPLPINMADLRELSRDMDTRFQQELKLKLELAYPQIEWPEEETETAQQLKPLAIPQYWVCDVIDGAVQYVQHLSGWTVNLTLIKNGEVDFSVIYDPILKETFWAKSGEGAFMNGERIVPNKKKNLNEMLAVWEYTHHKKDEYHIYHKMGKSVTNLLEQFLCVRNYGPHALQLAYVGTGRIDLFLQEDLDTTNWLAGLFIAKEAGAEILTTDGKPWQYGSTNLMVAPKGVGQQFLMTINEFNNLKS
ncbi:myo-inositol-1(or 4)-monophosphatase [Mucilaginibacter lappiensis]|uniref:Myo-inositol-1(Or 4)-monophosphatase n=1 Tax=Mucilaginibacter lappiensis TaxID=354630 RepID=A0ABR6PJR8_9SPHI|nr:inositol monophosphatase family protein [Mucilaginibacter lappiensis]MBB6110017.1 myo-inositol-1(or 4)-monophosphatase [Mucilaginibacter lappiensis]SIR55306.1 myo-inositol-1(or 4)-monophosphatase [Mucilaginibacter lappiensis]